MMNSAERALMRIYQNDKTEYDYGTKVSLNRNGEPPPSGKRFKTPREIVHDYFGKDFWPKYAKFRDDQIKGGE
jgi:hypothetical protein